MAALNPTNRNLWIIAALVAAAAAVLAWFLDFGAGAPAGGIADVSVAELPGPGASDDRALVEAMADAGAPPSAGMPGGRD
ncbi:hypothetical protein [Paracoccus sp. MC1862]|uniref:hypothetical protein n=1 Tax=Paracoccus sp. MC1862 TaxID=2760307 RepID=UPI00160027D7|nr:hypothetical protein [Paracoccus sp. MC1862]MBB1497401.1 hypothetical protein [Paracoccus sp. MC1862]QQO45892.1 hypothetical protein JGR78_06205 [Paracoccus sp. MC1862]